MGICVFLAITAPLRWLLLLLGIPDLVERVWLTVWIRIIVHFNKNLHEARWRNIRWSRGVPPAVELNADFSIMASLCFWHQWFYHVSSTPTTWTACSCVWWRRWRCSSAGTGTPSMTGSCGSAPPPFWPAASSRKPGSCAASTIVCSVTHLTGVTQHY